MPLAPYAANLQRYAAPLCGVALTLGFAPFNLWPLALAGLVGWLHLLRQSPTRRAAITTTLHIMLMHGATSLYWLPWAFYYDSLNWWFALGGGIPAALVLAAWAAVGYALAVAAAWRWHNQPLLFNTLVAVGVVGIELLRNTTPFGFPWLPLGAVWATGGLGSPNNAPLLAQLASVGGVQLLSALVLVLAVSIATFTRTGWLVAALLLSSTAGFGYWRTQQPLPAVSTGIIRVVQPNQGAGHKWDATLRWAFLNSTLRTANTPQTTSATGATPQLIILPETGVPFFLAQEPEARAALQIALPNTTLLTGAVRREEQLATTRYFNSLQVVTAGEPVSSYDKKLLVPFGEFIPLRGLIEALPLPVALRTLSQSRIDFTHGTTSPLLATPVGTALGLICYEGIFPTYVGRHAAGARYLANVTNDAWFTGTSALAQHAALQRLRSIETGLPLVRSANTGVSMVVNPYGAVVAQVAPNQTGVIDIALPAALPPTLWVRLLQRIYH